MTHGFTVSPEIGVRVFSESECPLWVHVALYYNYATNKSKSIDL